MYEALLPLFVHIINKYAHTRMNSSKFNTMQKVWKWYCHVFVYTHILYIYSIGNSNIVVSQSVLAVTYVHTKVVYHFENIYVSVIYVNIVV